MFQLKHDGGRYCFTLKSEGVSLNADYAIWADSLTKHYRSGGSEIVVFDDLDLRVRGGRKGGRHRAIRGGKIDSTAPLRWLGSAGYRAHSCLAVLT